jgi:hypothetical protein
MAGDAGGHLADRPQPEHGDAATAGDRRVVDRLPRGRQDVGQIHEPFIRWAAGDLDRAEVGLRHTQELRLAAGHLPVQLRVAEQGGAHALLHRVRCTAEVMLRRSEPGPRFAMWFGQGPMVKPAPWLRRDREESGCCAWRPGDGRLR